MRIAPGFVVCTAHNTNTPLSFEDGGPFQVRLDLLRPAMRVIVYFDDQPQRRQQEVGEEPDAVEVSGELETIRNAQRSDSVFE